MEPTWRCSVPPALATKTLNLTQAALKGVRRDGDLQRNDTPGRRRQNYQVYALTAAATNSSYGQPEYVARDVTRNVTNAPP